MPPKLLELTTLDPERPLIVVDGTGYELQLPDDFGLLELARLQRLQTTVAEVMGKTDFSDEDVQALAGALDGFTRLVLPGMPADVRGRLRDNQKLAIVASFRQAAGQRGKTLPPSLLPIGES